MKLNLLPTTEKKSRQGKTAVVLAALIVLSSLAASFALIVIPTKALNDAKEPIPDLKAKVAKVDATSKRADTIISTSSEVILDAQLAQALIDHNNKYPKLYNDLKRYIPPYYRIQSMSALPIGENLSQVTLVGTLSGYQRYADLMLALMRYKEAQTITRSGYNLNDPTVPALDPADQIGKMRLATSAPIPDDGLERLAYFQAQAAAEPSGYLATSNYGSGTPSLRGPLPGASVVTIVMTIARDLRVPLAASTLRGTGGGAAGATPAGVPAALPSSGSPAAGAGR